mmetsp:Transcript_26783/g.62930  ORF Transcript_26783/g.62930 Transcript_26783/m.62930 type:complete len:200 (-) Transcript_26783:432-1031(-)
MEKLGHIISVHHPVVPRKEIDVLPEDLLPAHGHAGGRIRVAHGVVTTLEFYPDGPEDLLQIGLHVGSVGFVVEVTVTRRGGVTARRPHVFFVQAVVLVLVLVGGGGKVVSGIERRQNLVGPDNPVVAAGGAVATAEIGVQRADLGLHRQDLDGELPLEPLQGHATLRHRNHRSPFPGFFVEKDRLEELPVVRPDLVEEL